MYNRKAFKREAKQLMRQSTPHYMLVMLVYVLLTTGLSYAVTALTDLGGLMSGALGVFLNVLLFLFSMVLSVGLAHYALNLTRKKPTCMGDLFEGFSFAGRSIGVNLLVAVYTILWVLLIAVAAGIVLGVGMAVAGDSDVVMMILGAVVYVVLMVFSVILVLRYSMAQFALAEYPEGGARAAIRRSVQVMKKNKGKFFVLQLSFIGWGLLVVLIVMAVLALGVLVSGVEWFVGIITSVGSDPMAAYDLAMELGGHLAIWTVVAEVVCLPLTLWLTAYQQTAYARFYNYVCGYDYHKYMNEGGEEQPAEPSLPETAPEVESEERPVPPGGFYTPVPKLDEEVVEEPAQQRDDLADLEEILETLDEEEAAEADASEE